MSVLDEQVRSRAGNRCEYCRAPQAAFRRPFHIEHIIAKQHGGTARLDNLALACPGTGTLRPLYLEIQGLTPIGRTTVRVLGLNEGMQQMLRHEFWLEGLYGMADV